MTPAHRHPRLAASAAALALALAATTVGLAVPGTAGAATVVNAEKITCPAAVTTTCLTVGNVSTTGGIVPGLFLGAPTGVNAYLSYLDSTQGGVDGHKIALIADDDQFNGTNNQSETQALLPKVLAFVGNYSLDDQDGGTVLAAHPDVPDVSAALSLYVSDLPNDFSIAPVSHSWGTGALVWFKQHDASATKHVGILIAQESSAETQAAALTGAMKHLGYHIAYSSLIGPLDTSFTTQVLAMEHSGVQFVDLTAMDATDAEIIITEMHQQGWHPTVIESAGPIYTPTFVKSVGGASVADGIYLDQHYPLYLGGDAKTIPEVATFLAWVHKVNPGFEPDLFTLFGWTEAQLFTQALKAAGPNPTSASVTAALKNIHSFDAGGMLPPGTDPSSKITSACWVLAQVKDGKFVRVPPSPDAGYICKGATSYPPQTPS